MGVIVLNRIISAKKLPEIGRAFADYTWEEVSAVCKAGLAAEYWQIGDERSMSAGAEVYPVRIIGFNHDYVSDPKAYGREKAGITVEVIGRYSELKGIMNSVSVIGCVWYHEDDNYYCDWRSAKLPVFWNSKMPEELKNVIVPVEKEYLDRDSSLKTISDNLFLLSANEIFGTYTSGPGSEGTQYAYYAAGNRFHGASNISSNHWTRSSNITDNKWMYVRGTSNAIASMYVTNGADNYGHPTMCI